LKKCGFSEDGLYVKAGLIAEDVKNEEGPEPAKNWLEASCSTFPHTPGRK
jgi:hypothetical protein